MFRSLDVSPSAVLAEQEAKRPGNEMYRGRGGVERSRELNAFGYSVKRALSGDSVLLIGQNVL